MNAAKMNGVTNGLTNGHAHTNGYSNGQSNGHAVQDLKQNTSFSRPVEDQKETKDQITFSYEVIEEIAAYLLTKTNIRPKIGIICGSGLGPLADTLSERKCFPYSQIPHFPESTVAGHAGQLVFGNLKGVPVVCMQGRFHYYEGYPLWKCSMPVRVMKLVGVTHFIATNAAGGLREGYKVGDIMILKDHINMMGFAGNNPLRGTNDERFGPRFPAMNKAYDTDLIQIAKDVAQDMGVSDMVHEGIYTCLGGPCFETIAELKLLRLLGVDAVGMSTVHEVITAVHCGMKVFGFSLITNECVIDYDSNAEANHEEVMDTAKMRTPILQDLVSELVSRIAQQF